MTRLGEAVEALARALGLWSQPLSGFYSKWALMPDGDGFTAVGPAVPEPPDGEYGYRLPGPPPYDRFRTHLTPHEAMIWLRCYLLGTTRVRCPDCEGSLMVTEYVRDAGYSMPEDYPCPTCTGPAVECKDCLGRGAVGWSEDQDVLGGGVAVHCHCVKPTGRVDRSWAEVFLRAMPSRTGPWDSIATDDPRRHIPMVAVRQPDGTDHAYLPGDSDARERLTRLADQLQAQALEGLGGDSPEQHPDLGVWMALWLASAPCPTCEGRGFLPGTHIGDGLMLGTSGHDRCYRCAGSGIALSAHAAAMASAALELAEALTAQEVAS